MNFTLTQGISFHDKVLFFDMELSDMSENTLKKHDPIILLDEDHFEHKQYKNNLHDRFLDQNLYS